MDALERVLWEDASDEDASIDAHDHGSLRGSPIHRCDAPTVSDPLLTVQMKLPTPVPSGHSPSRLLKPERVRTTLRRRKGEIARLRIAADYLERCLAQLQDKQPDSPNRENAAEDPTANDVNQLEESQRENERLKAQARDKYALARELEERVAAHYAALCDHFATEKVPPSPFLQSPREADPEVLDGLLQTLDAMYLQTDSVFADARYASVSPIFTDVEVHRQCDPDVLAVELHDARLVPFDIKATAQAVWHNVLGRAVRPQSGWVEQLPNETLRSHFVAYMKLEGVEGHARCIVALRRIVEETRIVIVRCSILTHLHPRRERPMNSRILGWIVVQQPVHPALHAHENITQVQHCSVTVPTVLEGEDEDDIVALGKFFAGASRQITINSHEEVDCFLLANNCTPTPTVPNLFRHPDANSTTPHHVPAETTDVKGSSVAQDSP